MKPNPLLDRYLVPIPAPYQKKRKPKERKKEMDERWKKCRVIKKSLRLEAFSK